LPALGVVQLADERIEVLNPRGGNGMADKSMYQQTTRRRLIAESDQP